MKETIFEISENIQIAPHVFKMTLRGDTGDITKPGQFVNIKIEGNYLRRPISVCDLSGNRLVLIYKVVGEGTEKMSRLSAGGLLDLLTGLGNGYDLSLSGKAPLLLGGGVGIPPLYLLAKELVGLGKKVTVILGFNSREEVFFAKEFELLGCSVIITTTDGSMGIKGFVTDAMENGYSYFYACGPEPMLKAVYGKSETSGQLSFEKRMGCGFGACMGCSCKTITGYKRICKEGPVLKKEEII